MTITKEILKNAEKGFNFLKNNPNSNIFIKMRDTDKRYIDFAVEKDNWYYGKGYVYWDGSVYGFSFDENLFEDEKSNN